MSGRVWDRAYDSYASFYADVYGHVVREMRPAGRTGAVMMWAEQAAGDWSDAPTPDLVVTCLVRGSLQVTSDVGAGRRSELHGPGAFLVAPPDAPTTILCGDAHEVRSVAVPYAGLCALVGEEAGLPPDGDFGALHRGLQRDRSISCLLERLWAEGELGSPSGALWADGALLQLAAVLLRLRNQQDGRLPAAPARGGLAPWQVRRTTEFMLDQLDRDVALDELSALAQLSPFHFCPAFKQSVGVSPSQWQIEKRVERAKELMANTSLSLTHVALEVGYASQGAFGKAFRRVTGTSPSEWRRKSF